MDKRSNTKGKWVIIGIVILIAALVAIVIVINLVNKPNFDDKLVEYNQSIIGISTYTDYLECTPAHISVDFGDYDVQLGLDLSDSVIMAVDNYNNYGYIAYQTTNGANFIEVILTGQLTDELALSNDESNTLKRENVIFQSITYTEDTGIITEKTGFNYNSLGYVFVIHQTSGDAVEDSFKTMQITDDYDADMAKADSVPLRMALSINDCILLSNSDETNYYLELEGLGQYDFNSLSEFSGEFGASYSQDEILSLYNNKEGKIYGKITGAVNNFYDIDTTKLVQAEGWNNLYIHSESENIESEGYRMFGIQTSKGFYLIQLSTDAPDTLEDSIIELLGIKPEDTKIDTIF